MDPTFEAFPLEQTVSLWPGSRQRTIPFAAGVQGVASWALATEVHGYTCHWCSEAAKPLQLRTN